MHSSLVSKIEKARIYADDRSRFRVDGLRCEVRGDNGTHQVTLTDGRWRCDCLYFHTHEACSHSMAIERILEGMLPSAAAGTETLATAI